MKGLLKLKLLDNGGFRQAARALEAVHVDMNLHYLS